MKIEKINDNQIRCTLNKADLASREIKISELAYGTEKAKNLFRDMMQQASYEFGFEAEDIPLMIEAIPVSADCIILVITKVEDPEELDTRFSKFTQSDDDIDDEDEDSITYEETELNSAEEVLDLFKKVKDDRGTQSEFIPLPQAITSKSEQKTLKSSETNHNSQNIMKAYSFDNLTIVTKIAYITKDFYSGENSLYKAPNTKRYYLVLYKSHHLPEEFNKVCNILSEYGVKERSSYAIEAYFEEHYNIIISKNALQKLSLL